MLNRILGRGWLKDPPDPRDYTCRTKIICQMYNRLKVQDIKAVKPPECIDLREWCSPIENQNGFSSCTAHAAVGVIEFFIRKAYGKDFEACPFFLYKVTRNLIEAKEDNKASEEDNGAYVRETMKAMVLFGVPPESYCAPQPLNRFRALYKEPSAFCYALAQNYQAEKYHRLDSCGVSPKDLLHCIKVNLFLNFPLIFGFTPDTLIDTEEVWETGQIPYLSASENDNGGHVVVAVGYNDNLKIKNRRNGKTSVGALLIRNSWGICWGEEGYGWLPYKYVWRGQTRDWWCLSKNEWIDTGQFGLQSCDPCDSKMEVKNA